ncbi:hypothetical protein ACTI_70290 [Actinoplanes sp. OR16]|uniref:hypothetical protein n=1 Tax=Actinoplanes sp. OR16 TaxID=946334 RepID=UPI000F6E71AE|nr:hypothetical protein [Actinoplanes sp. OR16]BBH70344.1 hypothetical protein ACTI_70290 [Actinoplanes sp. OR16]
MYALYAWGNFIYEVGLDRGPEWLDPAVLSGERSFINDSLTILDTGPLLVDGPGTIYEVDDELIEGRELAGRDLTDTDWRVAAIRVLTDGTREDALRITAGIEEENDFSVDESPAESPLDFFGEAVTTWEDEHGQWDMVLLKLPD